MNPRRPVGLASVLAGTVALSGCSEPVRNDGHMFQRWADAVAAIPIDDGARQAPAMAAADQTQTQAQGRSPLKIDLIDHFNTPSSRELGLRAAVSLVDSELAGLRGRVAPDKAPTRVSTAGPAPADRDSGGALQTAGAFMAQLAAFPTREAAESAWERMRASHPASLGRLAARFESVDLGGRGVWTRLQAGPFPSREEAAAVCAEIGVADRWCVAPRRD